MDSIVFYQPPSPKWPSRSALDKSVPEPIDNEDDGWELPSLSEVLAEAKQKRAGVPVHQDCLSLVQERTNDGGRPVISQTSTRAATEDHIGAHVCSSRSGSTQQKNLSIEPHIDAKLSQSTRCQHNLAISAPKALDLISQNEGACRPVPLDVVDDQATYEEIVTGAQNDKQHCFGDQRSFGRVETSTRLDRSCDRIHGRVHDGQDLGAAAGNIYDIFAEYEKIFATSRKHGCTEREGQRRVKCQANDVIPRALSRSRSGTPSESIGVTPSRIDPQGSVIGGHDLLIPAGVASSSAPLPTQQPAKRPLGSNPATLDSGRKRIRTSRPAVSFTIDADRETRTRSLVPISLSDDDSSDDNDDESLDQVATSQQEGPPPVVPEDNQYLVERLLKRQVRRLRGRRRVKYLIQWKGYGPEHNSWVCRRDIHPELVRALHASTFGQVAA